MSTIDDGVIKYDRSFFTKTNALESDEYELLENWRHQLYQRKLIGEYEIEKVGYGNLSQRIAYQDKGFIITGTQTGHLAHLDGSSYTKVMDFDLENLKIVTQGPIEASSEALTHAAIYETSLEIQVVFHIHSTPLWNEMLKSDYPSTPKDIPYGTYEMAIETKKCIGQSSSGIFVMAGHQDGIISYGENFEEAGQLILGVYNKFKR